MSFSTDQINRRAHVSPKKTALLCDLSDGQLLSDLPHPETLDYDEGLESKGNHGSSASSGSSGMSILWKSLLCVACGMVFGIALHKSHVSYPDVVRNQMQLKQFILVKFFLSALATSMFTMSLLAMFPPTHHSFMIVCNKYFNKLADKSVTSSIVGGWLMGVGMTVAGSCPVAVFPQIGSLVPNVGYVFLGSLVGVIMYSVLKPLFDSMMKPTIKESSNPWSHSPYFVLALPLVAMFGITVCAFETLLPWDSELKGSSKQDERLALDAWPPYIAGMLVGMLQLPLVIGMYETLGGSSSFIVMISQGLVGPLKNLSPFACEYQRGFNHWWQIFYVGGAVIGGFLSALASGTLGEAAGVPPSHGFIGGVLLHLGARIGGGCTSGHGLSGMGLLSIMSFIMMACTFVGGMSTAFALQLFGVV